MGEREREHLEVMRMAVDVFAAAAGNNELCLLLMREVGQGETKNPLETIDSIFEHLLETVRSTP